jgi:hypothetical protein
VISWLIDQVREQGLLGWREELLYAPFPGQDAVNDPGLPGVTDRDQRQQAGGEQQVRGHHRPFAVPPVHEDTGEGAQHDLGDERRQQDEGRRQRRAGEHVDVVSEADPQDPVAGHRDEARAEQQPQVPLP